jgi:hypothetical protein
VFSFAVLSTAHRRSEHFVWLTALSAALSSAEPARPRISIAQNECMFITSHGQIQIALIRTLASISQNAESSTLQHDDERRHKISKTKLYGTS